MKKNRTKEEIDKKKTKSSEFVSVEIIKKKKISTEELQFLLESDNTELVSDFLNSYEGFTKQQQIIIQGFIIKRLYHSDRLFVSDLIDCAAYWNIELPYKKCIDLLRLYDGDNSFVQLSLINYLIENLRPFYFEKIIEAFIWIFHNSESEQFCQISAGFALVRITGRRDYLVELIDLVINGAIKNKTQLRNILKREYNAPEYFEYHDLLKALVLPIWDS